MLLFDPKSYPFSHLVWMVVGHSGSIFLAKVVLFFVVAASVTCLEGCLPLWIWIGFGLVASGSHLTSFATIQRSWKSKGSSFCKMDCRSFAIDDCGNIWGKMLTSSGPKVISKVLVLGIDELKTEVQY